MGWVSLFNLLIFNTIYFILVSSGQDVGGQRDSVPDVTRIIALSRSHKKKGHVNDVLVTYHSQSD